MEYPPISVEIFGTRCRIYKYPARDPCSRARKSRPEGRPFREKNRWRIFQNPGQNAPNRNVSSTGRKYKKRKLWGSPARWKGCSLPTKSILPHLQNRPKVAYVFFLPGGGWQLFTPVRCSANSPFSGGPYCLVAGIQPLFSRERESIPPDFPILSGKETEQRRK